MYSLLLISYSYVAKKLNKNFLNITNFSSHDLRYASWWDSEWIEIPKWKGIRESIKIFNVNTVYNCIYTIIRLIPWKITRNYIFFCYMKLHQISYDIFLLSAFKQLHVGIQKKVLARGKIFFFFKKSCSSEKCCCAIAGHAVSWLSRRNVVQ